MRVKIGDLKVGDCFKYLGRIMKKVSLREFKELFPDDAISKRKSCLCATFDITFTKLIPLQTENLKMKVEKITLSQPKVAESKNPPKKDALSRSTRKGALKQKER